MSNSEFLGDHAEFYIQRMRQRVAYERKLIEKGVKPRSSKMLELMYRKFK